MDTSDTVVSCKLCGREYTGSYAGHEPVCTTSLVRCPQCDELIKSSEWPLHLQQHAEVECPQCAARMQLSELDFHKQLDCPNRPGLCPYCETLIIEKDRAEHESFCGNRTEFCGRCRRNVKLNALDRHLTSNCQYPPLEPEPGSNKKKSRQLLDAPLDAELEAYRAHLLGDFNLPKPKSPDGPACPRCRTRCPSVEALQAHLLSECWNASGGSDAQQQAPPAVSTAAIGTADGPQHVRPGIEEEIVCEMCGQPVALSRIIGHQEKCAAGLNDAGEPREGVALHRNKTPPRVKAASSPEAGASPASAKKSGSGGSSPLPVLKKGMSEISSDSRSETKERRHQSPGANRSPSFSRLPASKDAGDPVLSVSSSRAGSLMVTPSASTIVSTTATLLPGSGSASSSTGAPGSGSSTPSLVQAGKGRASTLPRLSKLDLVSSFPDIFAASKKGNQVLLETMFS